MFATPNTVFFCGGKCSITREVRRGLASILEIACSKYKKTWQIESSPIIKGSAEIESRYSVNIGAVWGQMSTGGREGQKHLNAV